MSPDFWAEPANALTNLAFLFAAVMAYTDHRHAGPGRGSIATVCFIAMMMAIGAGSFAFHTYATRWAESADTIPIGIFVLTYLCAALVLLAGLRWWQAALALMAFFAASWGFFATGLADGKLNGSLGYAPPLAALLAIAAAVWWRGRPGAGWVVTAAGVFTVSLAFRTIDRGSGCFVHAADGRTVALGTHALWHVLNAVTLYMLVRALVAARAYRQARTDARTNRRTPDMTRA